MMCCGDYYYVCVGGFIGCDFGGGVFEYQVIGCGDVELVGGEQEIVGCGFVVGYVFSRDQYWWQWDVCCFQVVFGQFVWC